jgi:hypothetical protein
VLRRVVDLNLILFVYLNLILLKLIILKIPVTWMTIKESGYGSIALRSRTLNKPFGCKVSDLNEPEFKIQQSASTAPNIMSQIKFPKKFILSKI